MKVEAGSNVFVQPWKPTTAEIDQVQSTTHQFTLRDGVFLHFVIHLEQDFVQEGGTLSADCSHFRLNLNFLHLNQLS